MLFHDKSKCIPMERKVFFTFIATVLAIIMIPLQAMASTKVDIPPGEKVVQLSSEAFLTDKGTVLEWLNYFPRLMDVPKVEEGDSIKSIEFGTIQDRDFPYAVGLTEKGSVLFWGESIDLLQTKISSLNPNEKAIAISAGGPHSIFLRDDGSITTWGGDHHSNYVQPPIIPSGERVVMISAGEDLISVLTDKGTMLTWGTYGSEKYTPTIPEGDKISRIIADRHSMFDGATTTALTEKGRLLGWNATDSWVFDPPESIKNERIIDLSLTSDDRKAITDKGTMISWDGEGNVHTGRIALPGGEKAVQIETGRTHTIVLTDKGTVLCADLSWASGNDYNGVNTSIVQDARGKEITSIEGIRGYVLGVTKDKSVVVLEEERFDIQEGIPVPQGQKIVSISSFRNHLLALTDNGVVIERSDRQGSYQMPESLKSEKIIQVIAGKVINAALTEQGKVVTWGIENRNGLLTIPDNSEVVAMGQGIAHFVALTKDSKIFVWSNGDVSRIPSKLIMPENEIPVSACSHDGRIAGIAKSGKLFIWGNLDFSYRTEVKIPNGEKAVSLSPSYPEEFVLLSDSGNIYGIGKNGGARQLSVNVPSGEKAVSVTQNRVDLAILTDKGNVIYEKYSPEDSNFEPDFADQFGGYIVFSIMLVTFLSIALLSKITSKRKIRDKIFPHTSLGKAAIFSSIPSYMFLWTYIVRTRYHVVIPFVSVAEYWQIDGVLLVIPVLAFITGFIAITMKRDHSWLVIALMVIDMLHLIFRGMVGNMVRWY